MILRNLILIFIFIFLCNCQTINNKISKSTDEENKLLSRFLGKKSNLLKLTFGEPKIINLEVPYKTYVYEKSNLLIKCKREFFINPKTDIIEKFNSKNCIK